MKSLPPKQVTSEDGSNLLTKSSLLPACKHTWKRKHAKDLLHSFFQETMPNYAAAFTVIICISPTGRHLDKKYSDA